MLARGTDDCFGHPVQTVGAEPPLLPVQHPVDHLLRGEVYEVACAPVWA